jgi:thioredoxin-related protein
MKNLFTLVIALVLLQVPYAQQPSPLPADSILKEAYQQAKKENKNVFVIFHASWCTWCHRMDASMNDATCKKFFNDQYVIRHLVVDEAKDKKQLENPGGQEMLEKYEGKGQGIPFWLVLNSDGKLLSNSNIKEANNPVGHNAGCPATEEEVKFLVDVLKKTSTLNEAQLEIIRKRFRQNDR